MTHDLLAPELIVYDLKKAVYALEAALDNGIKFTANELAELNQARTGLIRMELTR